MSQPTPIADMITEMLKNGISIEMIIVAVRSMERAVPTRQGAVTRPGEQTSKRGARLSEDWRPLFQDRRKACDRLGSSDAVDHELLKFHDYWKAQPGQRGVKLDWDATWRNWIRNTKGPQNAKTNPPQTALGGFSGLAAQLRRKIDDDERRAAEAASRDGSLPGF